MPDTHIIFACIKHKFFISFIDGIIGQMYEIVLQVLFLCSLIVFCSETSQAFLVYVYSEWIAAIYKDIDPHIELQIVD